MPNWCENVLVVTGTEERVNQFDKAFQSKPAIWKDGEPEDVRYTFNAHAPVPQSVIDVGYSLRLSEKIDKKIIDGYTWCINNWGTKWDIDIDEPHVSKEPGSNIYYFDTAWGPPQEWLVKASYFYPDMTFHLYYAEPGSCFVGEFCREKGEITVSESYQWTDAAAQTILAEYFEGFGTYFDEEEEPEPELIIEENTNE